MPRTLSVGGGRAGQSLRTYGHFDFSGGVDIVTSPMTLALRPTNRVTEAMNVVFNIDGSVSKRWGFDLAYGAGVNVISGGIYFLKSDGTGQHVFLMGHGTVYKFDGTAASDIRTGLTAGTGRRASFAVYQDTVFLATNADPLQQWSAGGSGSMTAVGGGSPATPRQVVAHANRLFATSTVAGSRVHWCRLNNPLDWTGTDDAGFLDVNPDDGGVIKAMVPSIQELALLKTYRPYRLQGIGPVTGYTVADSLAPAAGSIGASGFSSATFVGNDVWYLSQLGLHRLSATDQFGDLIHGLASDAVEPCFRQDASYSPYGLTYRPRPDTAAQPYPDFINAAVLGHDLANNLLLCGQTITDPANGVQRFLVYDLRLKCWSFWNTITDSGTQVGQFTCLWPGIHAATQESELMLGMYSPTSFTSALMSMRRGILNDVSIGADAGPVPIYASVAHLSALGDPTLRKCPRRLFLYFMPVSTTTTITVDVTYDLATSPQIVTSFELSALSPETRMVKRIDLGGHLCNLMQVRLSNAGLNETFQFLGYEVQWQPRRYIQRTA